MEIVRWLYELVQMLGEEDSAGTNYLEDEMVDEMQQNEFSFLIIGAKVLAQSILIICCVISKRMLIQLTRIPWTEWKSTDIVVLVTIYWMKQLVGASNIVLPTKTPPSF